MSNQMDQIDHIVVLMLENRSLDCLLGYLYGDGGPEHFVPTTNTAPFDGVAGKSLFNLVDPLQPEGPNNPKIPVAPAPWQTQLDMTQPNPDPGEEYPHINRQLFGQDPPPSPPGPAHMSGFVADYIDALKTTEGWEDNKDPTYDQYKVIMNCFTPQAIPVLNGLARDFAVSDRWFCSVPSQTFCNRSFFNSGSSHGFVTNSDYVKWLENDQTTLFNLLTDNRVDWRVYWDKQDMFGSLTRLIHPPLYDKQFDGNFREYGHRYGHEIPPEADQFRKDCVAGDLPAFTFVEPRLFLDHNDMHPPVYLNPLIDSSILAGEILVNKIFEDLFVFGKYPDKTLLMITFDEHGGCYDHVGPCKAATPPLENPPYPPQDGFEFNRFGVRVPTIMVSPWIQSGTVFRSSTGVDFDHTSMIRTLCNKWKLEPNGLTDRDAAAPDFSDVLNGVTKRTSMPRYTPRHYVPAPEPEAPKSILSKLQRAIIELLTAKLRCEPPSDNVTVFEALHWIEKIMHDLGESK